MQEGVFDIENIDFGGVDLSDINLDDFDIAGDYNEETRYIKPKLYKIGSNYIMYENARKLAKKIKLAENVRYDVVVSGNFIFGDFIEAFIFLNKAKCKKLTISTLSLSQENVDSLENLIHAGYVDELNLIVSSYFYAHNFKTLIPYIYQHLDKQNKFQLAIAGVHTKTCQFETLGGKKIIMHGSANLRSSGNIEQFTIEENKELYKFYDDMFEKILAKYMTIKKSIRGDKLWNIIDRR